MATYASSTNPFIQTNSSSNGIKVASKSKEAPGQAKPQSSPSEGLPRRNNSEEQEVDLMPMGNPEIETKKILSSVVDLSELVDNNNNVDYSNTTGIESCCSGKDRDAGVVVDQADRSCKKAIAGVELEEAQQSISTETTTKGESDSNSNLSAKDAEEVDEIDEVAPMSHDDRRYQHIELIKKLRLQLRDLEKYAYERGELQHVPPSVLAEKQTVIIDTLKDRLSLNIDIEKLELDELKRQVDKEIQDLIDPLLTKDHLLSQLKTQLTDLERYISHLHGSLGKGSGKRSCLCQLHGCSSREDVGLAAKDSNNSSKVDSLVDDDTLPKTSRLIRTLVSQLICSDAKIQEFARREKSSDDTAQRVAGAPITDTRADVPIRRAPNFQDGAAWSLHLDKVVLATDSLVNLFTLEPQYQRSGDKSLDEGLIESIVRRQLVPAIKDLLTYGLVDANNLASSSSYASFLFDPYHILSSLTCFPSSQNTNRPSGKDSIVDRMHIWNVIEDYYISRNEPGFKNSSIKTLSQSFDLAPSISGPIKITSKQALLIAVDDIIETLSTSKPNGPESHFRTFIYTALNRSKLSTWLRLVFRNKSIVKKYYHHFSFVNQPDKMERFLVTIEPLNQLGFNLRTDVQPVEQFISAF